MEILVSFVLALPLVGAYAIFALGIVVIYQASRVLNLAHGGQAMFAAYVYAALAQTGLPIPVALVGGLVSGGVLGYGIERTVVRTLRRVSPTAQTVGTVAVFGVLVAVASTIWGTGIMRAPAVFPEGLIPVGRSRITYPELGLFGVMLVTSGGLFAFLRFTDAGLAMRATADNRRAAALMGVNPELTTSGAWVLGGTSAALAGILLGTATIIQPFVLSLQAVPAFVAALIGGLASLPGALVGSLVVGIALGLTPLLPFAADVSGGPQLVLIIIAFAVMATRGQTIVAGDPREGVF